MPIIRWGNIKLSHRVSCSLYSCAKTCSSHTKVILFAPISSQVQELSLHFHYQEQEHFKHEREFKSYSYLLSTRQRIGFTFACGDGELVLPCAWKGMRILDLKSVKQLHNLKLTTLSAELLLDR
jgi:hypothetical protein